MRTRAVVPGMLALLTLAGLLGAGCGDKLRTITAANQRPTVRLTYAPVDTTREEFYVYRMYWVGYDSDGRIDHFEYAVDPPSGAGQDTQWVTTRRNEEVITFTCTKPESLPGPGHLDRVPRGQGFHIFVIRSVDNLGMTSEPVARAFFTFGVAPTVTIIDPILNRLLEAKVPPSVRISWEGRDFIDPNGYVFERPVKYKFKLYQYGVMPSKYTNGDSLRNAVAPEFVGWDSLSGDTTQVTYTNLTPGAKYLFVVVAFGRSGAWSPIFSADRNMLTFNVLLASRLAPQITLYNSFFTYTYPSGGYPSPTPPEWAVQIQVPAAQPLIINWAAQPAPGALIRRYRWVLDLVDLSDATPRTDQNLDWYHWSEWSLLTSANVGPFVGAGGDTGEMHNFYLEAEDINGLKSLGWVQFRVIRPTFDRPLLIVNDTRFLVDEKAVGSSDSIRAPSGAWPNRAELDTFLFARGGVRWKYTPPGRLSVPGIFKGYSFDTMGTRTGREDPAIPLNVLGQYRHIIWMTDAKGAIVVDPPTFTTSPPTTTLRWMSGANRQNTLATWVSQGGRLWGLGGGFAHATVHAWNNLNNDPPNLTLYSSLTARPDLVAGRMIFDIAHWRSAFMPIESNTNRYVRYDRPDPLLGHSGSAYWKGGKSWYPATKPFYLTMPTELLPKSLPGDTLFPYRTSWPLPRFAEALTAENIIQERIPVTGYPDSTAEQSALDSIYVLYNLAIGGDFPQSNQALTVCMTYYHGNELSDSRQGMVFSGFDIWLFRKTHCIALVDLVLNKLWGLTRTTVAANPVASAASRQASATLQRSALRSGEDALRKPAGIPAPFRRSDKPVGSPSPIHRLR